MGGLTGDVTITGTRRTCILLSFCMHILQVVPYRLGRYDLAGVEVESEMYYGVRRMGTKRV